MQEGQLQCGIITTADSWPGVRAAVLQCYVLILQRTWAKLRWLRRRVRRLNTNLELHLNHDLVLFKFLELKIERNRIYCIYFNFCHFNWSLSTKCINVCNRGRASSKKLSNKVYVSAAVLRAGSDCMTAVKGRGSLGSGGSPAANILQIVRAGPDPSTGGHLILSRPHMLLSSYGQVLMA